MRRGSRGRAVVGLALLAAGGMGLASRATAQPVRPGGFRDGDVLVALAAGRVEWWGADGRFVAALQTGGSGQLAGMAFDPGGSLFVTHFNESRVVRLAPSGRPAGDFGSGYDASPESIAVDAVGDVYVGQADGTGDILKFDPAGQLLERFDVATEDRGSDWIDLAADQCTMLYTSEGRTVFRYDVCGAGQLEPFATELPGSFAYAVRALPDGGALVADSESIVRLDADGEVIRRYDAEGQDGWFALNLDPDGRSFWSAGLAPSSEVFRFDIESGDIALRFTVEDPAPSIGGLAVSGELTAALSSGPSLVASLPDPGDLDLDPLHVAANVAVAAGLVLLVPFPAELFNSTLEANYDRVTGWFRRRRGRSPGRFLSWRAGLATAPLLIVVAAIAAALYGFLDPTFGTNLDSLALYLGLFAGLLVVTAAFDLSEVVYLAARHRDRGAIRVFPASLPLALVCVVISRLARFQPGYLYGVLAGHGTREDLPLEEEGRMAAVRSVWLLVLAAGSWVGRIPVHDAVEGGAGFPLTMLDATLVVVVVAGLEGMVFGLLPLRFLDGERLFRWNRRLWTVLFGVSAFGFVYVLLNPQSGYLGRASAIATLLLFVGFGAVSVAFWAYFRYRGPRTPAPTLETIGPPPAGGSSSPEEPG